MGGRVGKRLYGGCIVSTCDNADRLNKLMKKATKNFIHKETNKPPFTGVSEKGNKNPLTAKGVHGVVKPIDLPMPVRHTFLLADTRK